MTSMTSRGSSSTVADLKPFFYGGIASCVAEAVTFPIDTAKTRLQLQGKIFPQKVGNLFYLLRNCVMC